jgi:hypothetical protein
MDSGADFDAALEGRLFSISLVDMLYQLPRLDKARLGLAGISFLVGSRARL